MCGIFGAVSKKKNVLPWLLRALGELEYRGYDSSGIALQRKGAIDIFKKTGGAGILKRTLKNLPDRTALTGIAHNRWATHGKVTVQNAHPQSDDNASVVLVHNGIIENFEQLRKYLKQKNHHFKSQTDTEVIAHLISHHYKGNFPRALAKTARMLEGSFALAVLSVFNPGIIYCLRRESSLVLGRNSTGTFCASDPTAIVAHTQKITMLENDEIAILTSHGFAIQDLKGRQIKHPSFKLDMGATVADKSKYKHFMLKEIYEQPMALTSALDSRTGNRQNTIILPEIAKLKKSIGKNTRIIIVGCGTSWHAALIGEYMLESLGGIAVEVEYASEFRYRDPILNQKNDIVIAISQSGETADTLEAMRLARKKGIKTLSICNVVGSTMAREADMNIYTKAGPEIGVASTKAFLTQLAILALLSMRISLWRKHCTQKKIKELIDALCRLPHQIETILAQASKIRRVSEKYHKAKNMMYMGRGEGYPVALEGALKLKEISYIHAEGYPAAEMKHGPIALIDEGMPSIIIVLSGRRYKKIVGNIQEIKARKGKVIALATKGDQKIGRLADDVIYIPKVAHQWSAVLAAVPLQLFAYFIANKRGCAIDKPKNLAKSVTVE